MCVRARNEPSGVVRVSEQLAQNNPFSASSSRGVSVPGLLQTRAGRRSQAGTGAKLLSAIMRGQRRQINAQVLMVHLFSLLQENDGRGGEGEWGVEGGHCLARDRTASWMSAFVFNNAFLCY